MLLRNDAGTVNRFCVLYMSDITSEFHIIFTIVTLNPKVLFRTKSIKMFTFSLHVIFLLTLHQRLFSYEHFSRYSYWLRATEPLFSSTLGNVILSYVLLPD